MINILLTSPWIRPSTKTCGSRKKVFNFPGSLSRGWHRARECWNTVTVLSCHVTDHSYSLIMKCQPYTRGWIGSGKGKGKKKEKEKKKRRKKESIFLNPNCLLLKGSVKGQIQKSHDEEATVSEEGPSGRSSGSWQQVQWPRSSGLEQLFLDMWGGCSNKSDISRHARPGAVLWGPKTPRAPRFEALDQRAVAAEEKLLVSLLVWKWKTEAVGRGLAAHRVGTALRGLPGAARNMGCGRRTRCCGRGKGHLATHAAGLPRGGGWTQLGVLVFWHTHCWLR